MKWKYCLMMIIVSLLFAQAPVSASAKDDSVPLVVNGFGMSEAKAYQRNDTMYIPFRAVFEYLGIPFEYDGETHSISYTFQDEPYLIDIREESIITPDGGYRLLIPILMIQQRTYIPQEYVEDLLRLEVDYDEKNDKLLVSSLDHAYSDTINGLAMSFYKQDLPASQLFTHDANPYGSLEDLYSPESAVTQVLDIRIGAIKYNSITEAVVITNQTSVTPAVSINQGLELHFRKEGSQWKISKINSEHLQIDLVDDVEEKAAALLQTSPEEVRKVLNDLQANYEALKGNDVEAAIKAYSPLYIDYWNRRVEGFPWEGIVEHQITFPSSRTDLLEAKVIYISDNTAAVYVKLLYTELPQTYDGLYEPGELEEPYEYEEVLYLDNTDGKRWTFNEGDPLGQNY